MIGPLYFATMTIAVVRSHEIDVRIYLDGIASPSAFGDQLRPMGCLVWSTAQPQFIVYLAHDHHGIDILLNDDARLRELAAHHPEADIRWNQDATSVYSSNDSNTCFLLCWRFRLHSGIERREAPAFLMAAPSLASP
jgi:hypothetical protein